MPSEVDQVMLDDPDFDVDPECDSQPVVENGIYTNAEYGCRIIDLSPQKVPTKNGDVAYVNINTIIIHPDMGGVFARTPLFGAGSTQLAKGAGSSWPQFAANLGLDFKPAEGEGVGEFWARIGAEARDMPVTVTVAKDSYVRKEDQLSEAERTAGQQPKRTYKNVIRNIVKE